MDNDQIKATIKHFSKEGSDVRVRDIAYTLLSRTFADRKTAYQCLFGGADRYDEYSTSEMRGRIEDYLTQEGFIRSISTDADTGEITFEENKSALTKMIADIEADMTKGVIEKKDGYARIVDIRTKLNDKFKVEAAEKDRMIVVEKKYNDVCVHCHHEIYVPTKEDLMEKYNLIERKDI